LQSDGFGKLLNIVIKKIDNLSMNDVAEIEKKLGGIDMKTDRKGYSHNGYYPNKQNFMIAGTKEYIKVIDKLISQTTEYFYTDKTDLVKAIFINWELTKPYNEDNSSALFFKNSVIIKRFRKEIMNIKQIVTKQLGIKPVKKGKGINIDLIWESNDGLKIEVDGTRSSEIRMIIYKE